MNRQELRTLLRKILVEAGNAKYTDTDMNAELSRSARAIAGQYGLIQSEVTGTTDAQGRLLIPQLVNVTGRFWTGNTGYQMPVINYSQQYDYDPRGPTAVGAVRALIVDEGILGPGTVAVWPNPGAGVSVTLMAFVDGGSMTADSDIPWGGRYEVYHDAIALHAAHQLGAWGGASGAKEPAWYQRYQMRMEELKDRGSAGMLLDQSRMTGALSRPRRRW